MFETRIKKKSLTFHQLFHPRLFKMSGKGTGWIKYVFLIVNHSPLKSCLGICGEIPGLGNTSGIVRLGFPPNKSIIWVDLVKILRTAAGTEFVRRKIRWVIYLRAYDVHKRSLVFLLAQVHILEHHDSAIGVFFNRVDWNQKPGFDCQKRVVAHFILSDFERPL